MWPFKKREIVPVEEKALNAMDGREVGWTTVFESYPGAWQQDVQVDKVAVTEHPTVFSCISLIANDIGKLRPKLMKQTFDGIWTETTDPVFSPLLARPNHYQNHIQFKKAWTFSLLLNGNSYVLKERDARGVVIGLYILDPSRVKALVSDSGDVFYRLGDDNLSGIKEAETVPASEIIHDRVNTFFHPLVGLSPIHAGGLSATQGLAALKNSTRFFTNMSRPSGMLTAPGAIPKETADRLKSKWESNYTGENFGRVAVLGDGLKYERISVTAVESQMLEQLKWTAEVVCSCFHVPPFKIGIGPMPTYQNAEVLNQIYYSDCLQVLIEQFEASMDEGLGLTAPVNGRMLGVELDLDDLLRMDTATKIKTLTDGVRGAVLTPNEARRRLNLPPLPGGDTVYLQQQNFSIAALDERDKDKPFVKPVSAPVAETPKEETP